MAEMDEFTPKDWVDVKIEPGKYGWTVEVKKCTFRNTDKEKPFMKIGFVVLEGDKAGFEFDDDVYITKKAEWRVRYFLKKFDYDPVLLERQPPLLQKAKIEGLRGKVLVEISTDNFGMLKTEVKKFDHLGGDEIEKELGKTSGSQEELPLHPATDAEPTREIDLNADVAGEQQAAPQEEVQEPPAPSEPEPDLSSLDD
jgi:hypothetical protein